MKIEKVYMYGKFWSVSLEHFIKHKPLISEECSAYDVFLYRFLIFFSLFMSTYSTPAWSPTWSQGLESCKNIKIWLIVVVPWPHSLAAYRTQPGSLTSAKRLRPVGQIVAAEADLNWWFLEQKWNRGQDTKVIIQMRTVLVQRYLTFGVYNRHQKYPSPFGGVSDFRSVLNMDGIHKKLWKLWRNPK